MAESRQQTPESTHCLGDIMRALSHPSPICEFVVRIDYYHSCIVTRMDIRTLGVRASVVTEVQTKESTLTDIVTRMELHD